MLYSTRDLWCCLATSLSLWDKFIAINIVPYKGALWFDSLLTSHNPTGVISLIRSNFIIPADSYGVWESSRALCSIIPAVSDTNDETATLPVSIPVLASQDEFLVVSQHTLCNHVSTLCFVHSSYYLWIYPSNLYMHLHANMYPVSSSLYSFIFMIIYECIWWMSQFCTISPTSCDA